MKTNSVSKDGSEFILPNNEEITLTVEPSRLLFGVE